MGGAFDLYGFSAYGESASHPHGTSEVTLQWLIHDQHINCGLPAKGLYSCSHAHSCSSSCNCYCNSCLMYHHSHSKA